MSKTKDIVKSAAKKTDLTAAKTGSDPRDPWSATGAGGGIAIPENVTSRRADLLSKYYKSRGYNINYVGKNQRVATSKKGDYEKWKHDRGIYEDDQIEEDLTTKISHPEVRSEIKHSPTLKRKRQLDQASSQYEVPSPAGTMKHTKMKKESLDEVSLGDYKEKAKAQVKELKPHAKGEYGDIVKRAVKRRESGLAMAAKREEVELDEISFAPYSRKGAPKTPAELEKIRKALAREKKNTVPGQLKQNEPNYKKDNYKKDTTLKYFSKIGEEEEIDEAKTSSAVKLQRALEKEKAKSTASVLRAKQWMDQMKQDAEKKKEVKEDNFGDPKAASEVPFDMANTPNQVAPKKTSKAGSMVKEIYAKHRLKEDMYDWEKDEKQKPIGKKPSVQKVDGSNELGDKKPKARMVLKGGTTLTGEKRDMVEIDPMLKNRTSMPDYKDMDKKNQKTQEQ
jgi:hypothetical protein